MSIDKKDIEKIVDLDKAEFEKRLAMAIGASGIDISRYECIIKDSEKIKSALSNLNSNDLKKLSDLIEKNNMGQLEKILKDGLEG